MKKLTELKLLIVKCYNTVLLKMQNGHPFDIKSQKVKNIKEAILAVDYIENNCEYDSLEASKLIEYHILNLKY